MVDVTVTAAEVLKVTGTQTTDGTAGAAITAGELVYLDSSTEYQLADIDSTVTTAKAVGIALNDAAASQPLRIAIGGTVDPGFTVVVGEIYVASGTAGKIAPVADLATGDFTFIVGIGITASSLKLILNAGGVAKP